MELDSLTKKFAIKVFQAWEDAENNSSERENHQIDASEFLLVLLDQTGGKVRPLLIQIGINVEELRKKLKSSVTSLPSHLGPVDAIEPSLELSKIIRTAHSISQQGEDSFISSKHILMAVTLNSGGLRDTFYHTGITREKLQDSFGKPRSNVEVRFDETTDEITDALQLYTTDLTELAEQGKLDPVIGRDDEIRRAVRILQRRSKNNPVLIGEPGVGKTAIVEGLAQRIVSGDVAEGLKNKRLLSLDIAQMVAGTKYRGEFEERMKELLNELIKHQGEIILFVDEIHTTVGAGASDGAMDASNMAKPALARGDLHCIGATTLNEYRESIEKDAALERRFQTVLVGEPNEADSIAILRGLKGRYEAHHGVDITDAAIIEAVKLSQRYISGRQLPDKAIDLIDEAASGIRLEIDSKPEKIDRIERRIIQLKIEAETLIKETDDASKEQLEQIYTQISRAEIIFDELQSTWDKEKDQLQQVAQLKADLEQARIDLEASRRTSSVGRMSELQYDIIPKLEESIKLATIDDLTVSKLQRNKVTEDEIADIVSQWTGIPVSKMHKSQREGLLNMEEHIGKQIIGQKEVVAAVSSSVRRSRAGLSAPNRPNSSFFFLGSTGVGKTELCKSLAKFLFDADDAMVRIDMSEFMERQSVARFIGAPPGYVGHEEGGHLTEAVRRRPYSVLLLDEIEKAHKDVVNILLQILEDGRLTDGRGHTVDFRNTVIVMTSNLGSDLILNDETNHRDEKTQKQILEVVGQHFRPEFINRIDEILLFNPLSKQDTIEIAKLQLIELQHRLVDKDLKIDFNHEVLLRLVELSYNPAFGARPLKRAFQRWIENPLADKILAGTFNAGDTIFVTIEDDKIIFVNA